MMFKSIDGFSKTATQIIVVIAFLGALYLVSGSAQQEYAEVSINFGDRIRTFQGEVVEHMTVLEALQASALAGNVPLQFIVDVAKDETQVRLSPGAEELIRSKKIQFYINENLIHGSKIHQTPVRPRDKITVKLL